jgi:hypothetical protein
MSHQAVESHVTVEELPICLRTLRGRCEGVVTLPLGRQGCDEVFRRSRVGVRLRPDVLCFGRCLSLGRVGSA